MVDAAGSEGRDPLDDFRIINEELEKYGEPIGRPQLVVLNKCDLIYDTDEIKALQAKFEEMGYKVAEDDRYFAFLDINPMTKGHTLVIPKFEAEKEGDYIFDMDDEMYAGLMMFAKRVAKAIEAAVECKRVGVAVMGMEVPM